MSRESGSGAPPQRETFIKGKGFKIFNTENPMAIFNSDKGNMELNLENIKKAGYEIVGKPVRTKSSTGGSISGGASHEWCVSLKPDKEMAGARTLFIRTPQGEEAVVVHKTSQVLDGREVWASADGTVAILDDDNSLREEGGWSEKENKAWSGSWPNYDDDREVDAETEKVYKAAVQEAAKK
ncbi:MAG: hypothetical protein AAB678_01855 [Patescibacteria group bacterium]